MGPQEFADACRKERDTLPDLYSDETAGSAVSSMLAAANLTAEQRAHVVAAIEGALTDALDMPLLALDGCASLGGLEQQFIRPTGKNGAIIANGNCALEAAAYEVLHGA